MENTRERKDTQGRSQPPPDEPSPRPDEIRSGLNRRAFLTGTAALIGVTATQALLSQLRAEPPSAPEDPTKESGAPPSAYGQRSTLSRRCG